MEYLVGNKDILQNMGMVPALEPFSEDITEFLNAVSRKLLSDTEAKGYPDIVTLAFWMRKASVYELKERFFGQDSDCIRIGRGVAFHIAPSNVPVNFAYSLAAGLMCGNANVVRIPSKLFEQTDIIVRAVNAALCEWPEMVPYIALVKYGHDKAVNDALSNIADVRVVWGGDQTIAELRESKLGPRATEITFADRYSLAVIDSNEYMKIDNKARVANDFYNDTYLSDQNACTSPRVVVWMGSEIENAKEIFWSELHVLVKKKYTIQGVQAVNKLTSAYMAAVLKNDIRKEPSEDNLIIRIKVHDISADLMELKDNSGYFFEYDCKDALELKDLCNDLRCQTLAYIGKKETFMPLIRSGIKGIDRIVPVGKTMDFDLMWDGYDLFERLTRGITIH